MHKYSFDIYNYRINIESQDFSVSQLKITEDLNFFSQAHIADAHLQIQINSLKNYAPHGFYLARTRMCEVRQVNFSTRQMIYKQDQQILAVLLDQAQKSHRKIVIEAANIEIVDDILYFLINSCIGEYLDSNALMRLHALSFTSAKRSQIIYGPPGAGKSTLALNLLQKSDAHIFADETTLLDLKTKKLLPNPLRISSVESVQKGAPDSKFNYFFSTKKLIPIPTQRISTPQKADVLYILKNFSGSSLIEDVGFLDRTLILLKILLGLGLIQMWEFLLRPNNIFTLLFIFKNRLKLIAQLSQIRMVFLKQKAEPEKIISLLL